jgi:hypothetical protein
MVQENSGSMAVNYFFVESEKVCRDEELRLKEIQDLIDSSRIQEAVTLMKQHADNMVEKYTAIYTETCRRCAMAVIRDKIITSDDILSLVNIVTQIIQNYNDMFEGWEDMIRFPGDNTGKKEFLLPRFPSFEKAMMLVLLHERNK